MNGESGDLESQEEQFMGSRTMDWKVKTVKAVNFYLDSYATSGLPLSDSELRGKRAARAGSGDQEGKSALSPVTPVSGFREAA